MTYTLVPFPYNPKVIQVMIDGKMIGSLMKSASGRWYAMNAKDKQRFFESKLEAIDWIIPKSVTQVSIEFPCTCIECEQSGKLYQYLK